MLNNLKYFFIRLWYRQIWGGVYLLQIHFKENPFQPGDHGLMGWEKDMRYLGNSWWTAVKPEPKPAPIHYTSMAARESYHDFSDTPSTSGWGSLFSASSDDEPRSFSGFGGGESGGGGASGDWGGSSDDNDSSSSFDFGDDD